jgi:hypothetical protein
MGGGVSLQNCQAALINFILSGEIFKEALRSVNTELSRISGGREES